jgi:hypothetical protein
MSDKPQVRSHTHSSAPDPREAGRGLHHLRQTPEHMCSFICLRPSGDVARIGSGEKLSAASVESPWSGTDVLDCRIQD